MSEYKFEKEIIGSIHTAEDRYAIDKEDYEGFEKQREELSEVYRKAEAWDDFVATMDYNYPTYEDRKRGITWDNPNHVVRQFSAVIDRYEESVQE